MPAATWVPELLTVGDAILQLELLELLSPSISQFVSIYIYI